MKKPEDSTGRIEIVTCIRRLSFDSLATLSKHLKFLVLIWLIIIVYNCINVGRESVKRNTLIDQLIQQLITFE